MPAPLDDDPFLGSIRTCLDALIQVVRKFEAVAQSSSLPIEVVAHRPQWLLRELGRAIASFRAQPGENELAETTTFWHLEGWVSHRLIRGGWVPILRDCDVLERFLNHLGGTPSPAPDEPVPSLGLLDRSLDGLTPEVRAAYDLPPLCGGIEVDNPGRALARTGVSIGGLLGILEQFEQGEREASLVREHAPPDDFKNRLALARLTPNLREQFLSPLEQTPAYVRLQDYCAQSHGSKPTAILVQGVIGRVRALTKLSRDDVLLMPLSEAMDVIENGATSTRTPSTNPSKPDPMHVLRRSAKQALESYDAVVKAKPGLYRDRDVYEHMKFHGCDVYAPGEIPGFESWSRYLREGRKATDQQKNHPRGGREHGNSIIPYKENA